VNGDVRARYGHRRSRPRPWLFGGLTVAAAAVAAVVLGWTGAEAAGSTARLVVAVLVVVGLPAMVGAVLVMLWRRAVYVELTGSTLRWSGLLRRGELALTDLRQVHVGRTARGEAGDRTRYVTFRAGRTSVTVHEAPAVLAEGSLGSFVAAVAAQAPHVRLSDTTQA
jgi:hypothetical protein